MKPTDKITFRLSPKVAELLATQSKAQGVSSHLLARTIVEDRLALTDLEVAIQLQAQEIVSLYESQAELIAELKTLRSGLIATFEVLFVQVARVNQEEAQKWLDTAFSRE